jgi:chorismate mutase/prephenate dehydratase
MKVDVLTRLRDQVKEKDNELVRLLNERAELSVKIGDIKKSRQLHIYDPSQEAAIFRHVNEINSGPLPQESLNRIFNEVVSASRALQAPVLIAYLGPDASFSHLASQSHFGGSAIFAPQSTIIDVFEAVEKGRADRGVVPVENSLEGTVKLTLDRLVSSPLNILSEIYLPIRHALMSTVQDTDQVQHVYSHPQALAPRASIHEVESTAAAARKVLEDEHGAAVGSSTAAPRYDLTVLADGIADCASNITRFLVIGKGTNAPTGNDKTSLIFATRHEPGALHRSLRPFAQKNINLQKIVSHPVRDRVWEYIFFIDFTGHAEEETVKECLEELRRMCTFVTVMGSYPAEVVRKG